jgi:hypothetical protein
LSRVLAFWEFKGTIGVVFELWVMVWAIKILVQHILKIDEKI